MSRIDRLIESYSVFISVPWRDDASVRMRVWERGVGETLACGTGALAVSFISHRLKFVDTDRITIHPHRCRWEMAIGRRGGTGGTDWCQARRTIDS